MDDLLQQALAASSAAADAARANLPDLDLGKNPAATASMPPNPDPGAPQNIPDVDASGLTSIAAHLVAMQNDMENFAAVPPDATLEHRERLLQVADGEVFVLVSSGGAKMNLYREGDVFFRGKKGSGKPINIEELVKKMQGAWILKEATPSSSPAAVQAPNQASATPSVQPTTPSQMPPVPPVSSQPTPIPPIPSTPVATPPSPATPEPVNAVEDEETRIRGERILGEADLIRRGAKYVPDEARQDKKGDDRLRLQLTDEQNAQLRKSAEKENAEFDKKKKKVKGREYSDEEMATLMASRKLSDAELVKNGAVYFKDNNGNYVLNPTEDQRKAAREEMEDELENKHKKDFKERVEEMDARAKDMAGVSELDGEITRLTAELAEARKAYAETEYRKSSAWARIKSILHIGSQNKDADKDIQFHKGHYQQTLNKLIDARLERLKSEHHSEEELREKMAIEFRYFGAESKIELYKAWTDARTKREGIPAKALGLFEDVGKAYNKLNWKTKAAIGLALAGASIATGGVAAVAGLILVRRAALTAGAFVTADSAFEKIATSFQERGLENDVLESGEIVRGSGDIKEQLAKLDELLRATTREADTNLSRRKFGFRARKIAALTIGGVLGFASGALIHKLDSMFFSGDTAPAYPAGPQPGDTGAGAKTPSVGRVNTPGGGGADPGASMKAPTADTKNVFADAGATSSSGEAVPSVSSGGNFGSFEVSKGDNTWKILEKHLAIQNERFANLDPERQTHAINTLKNQLKTFSPEKLKDLGFGSKDIDALRVGETINLDKAFSAADIEKAVSGAEKISDATTKSIAENNAKIAEWIKAHPGERLTDKVIDEEILGQGSGVTGQAVHGRGISGVPSSTEVPPDSIPIAIPEPSPSIDHSAEEALRGELDTASAQISELQSNLDVVKYRPRVEDWSRDLLRTPENENIVSLTNSEIQKKLLDQSLSNIARDVKLLQAGNISGYITGLNADQLKNFVDFSSDKKIPSLVEFYNGHRNATVGDYLKHIAPSVQQGQRIGISGLFTTTR